MMATIAIGHAPKAVDLGDGIEAADYNSWTEVGTMTRKTTNNPITYAVVQSGYCVFGVGSSRAEAIADAAKWLEDEYGRQGGMTAAQVEAQIEIRPNDGDLCVLSEGDDAFDNYMANQGGFEKRDGAWFKA
jgi:hypothetical protein